MMRILAVDDDPVILDLLTGCLTENDNYELVCAESSEEALEILQDADKPFDSFLLDIMLPGISGISLCETIRDVPFYRAAPIVMITASREPAMMQRAFDAGATDFLCKPLDGVELSARINSASMLNASLLREREAQHTLSELTEMMKIRFDEGFDLNVEGCSDFLALENYLLRLPSGCFSMNLFSVAVEGARGIYRAVKAPAFRRQMEQVASATIHSLHGMRFHLAYAGSGRYVGVVLSRARLNTEAMEERMHEYLEKNWDGKGMNNALPPSLRVSSVSEQRLWSGLSASNKLREHLESWDPLHGLARHDEDNLFAQLETAIDDER
ncbi:PleD family two-component system response regulator [Sulfitobacter sp. PS-8MA]|uniref:PleD family two-component system response regulator n=1 Tax=Sulfitobacter sp. PS-8MA TaxID=3237707 RepID=UPI0034C679D9